MEKIIIEERNKKFNINNIKNNNVNSNIISLSRHGRTSGSCRRALRRTSSWG